MGLIFGHMLQVKMVLNGCWRSLISWDLNGAFIYFIQIWMVIEYKTKNGGSSMMTFSSKYIPSGNQTWRARKWTICRWNPLETSICRGCPITMFDYWRIRLLKKWVPATKCDRSTAQRALQQLLRPQQLPWQSRCKTSPGEDSAGSPICIHIQYTVSVYVYDCVYIYIYNVFIYITIDLFYV